MVPEAREALARIEASPPGPDELVITHWAELAEAARVTSLDNLLALRGQHIWSDEAARERFERWGESAVHVLILRVHALPGPARLPVRAAYAGCRSWVDLQDEVGTAGSAPVLDDTTFDSRLEAVRAALGVKGAA